MGKRILTQKDLDELYPDEVEVVERWHFEQGAHHKATCNKHYAKMLSPILQCTCGADKNEHR